jgi:hypothetical protein
MFSQISLNWQGIPLETYETVVSLIAETTTRTGLRVKARLDRRSYALKEKVPDEVMARLRIRPGQLNPQWNYTAEPRKLRQGTLVTNGVA